MGSPLKPPIFGDLIMEKLLMKKYVANLITVVPGNKMAVYSLNKRYVKPSEFLITNRAICNANTGHEMLNRSVKLGKL